MFLGFLYSILGLFTVSMGIRFRCPHGHKLNVKSFLAGKRGLCPRCGASVIIPRARVQVSASSAPTETGRAEDVQPVSRRTVGTQAGHWRQSVGVGPSRPSNVFPVVDQIAAPADLAVGAPQAVWYVLPPTGGQYGPASTEIIRNWVAEGRITPDTLIWRDGWADWRRADSLFHELAAGLESRLQPAEAGTPTRAGPIAIAADNPVTSDPVTSGPLTIDTQAPARQRKSSAASTTLVVGLILISLVLLGTLIYVITAVN